MKATVIALHGDDGGKIDLLAWSKMILDYSSENQFSFDCFAVSGDELEDHVMSVKNISTFLDSRKIKDIKGLQFYSSDGQGNAALRWKFCAEADNESMLVLIGFPEGGIAVERIIDGLIAKIVNESGMSVKYGYVFNRDIKNGPGLFVRGAAMGLGASSVDREEASSIEQWLWHGIVERSYLKGNLRDVYQINLLSYAHLNRVVYGMTLEDWILSNAPERGVLSPYKNGLYLWHIQSGDVFAVRRDLKECGIFC